MDLLHIFTTNYDGIIEKYCENLILYVNVDLKANKHGSNLFSE